MGNGFDAVFLLFVQQPQCPCQTQEIQVVIYGVVDGVLLVEFHDTGLRGTHQFCHVLQSELRRNGDVLGIDLDPYCVVIEGGTNDIAAFTLESTFERIKKMADTARKAHIDVIVGSVPPSNLFPKLPDFHPEDRIIELNRMIKEWADAEGIPYADYYSVLVDDAKGLKKAYQKDTVHPNGAGYTEMEKVIVPILKSVLSHHIK